MAGNAWVQNGTCSEFQVTCMQPKRRVRGLEVFYYFTISAVKENQCIRVCIYGMMIFLRISFF